MDWKHWLINVICPLYWPPVSSPSVTVDQQMAPTHTKRQLCVCRCACMQYQYVSVCHLKGGCNKTKEVFSKKLQLCSPGKSRDDQADQSGRFQLHYNKVKNNVRQSSTEQATTANLSPTTILILDDLIQFVLMWK